MKKTVSFSNNEITLTWHLYLPDNIDENKKYPAVVISHPFGGVKEQTADLYALELCQQGFIALAFDASYQVESKEDPASRVGDIRCAVDYLSNHPLVDESRIGALGNCSSEGYVFHRWCSRHTQQK
ncbi:MAG: alpha/beta hydrolase [Bacillota bacterium]